MPVVCTMTAIHAIHAIHAFLENDIKLNAQYTANLNNETLIRHCNTRVELCNQSCKTFNTCILLSGRPRTR